MREGAPLAVYPGKDQLAEAAAERFFEAMSRAIRKRGGCFIALAGGSTPRDLYSRLAARSRQSGRPWDKAHLFWGDERAAAPDSPQSNYRMAKESLLDHIDIPPENVHRIRGEIPAAQAAAEYGDVIRGTMPSRPPRFDLVLLGVGEDGHTASLFPGTPVLDEGCKDVAAVYVEKLQSWRVTLTCPILNRSRQVIFLVAGPSKAGIMERIRSLKTPSKEYPASLVQAGEGRVQWMLDQQAARLIENRREAAEE